MSRENVEVVRGAIAAFRRGGVESALEFFDPEIEWHDPPIPGAAVFRGHDGVRRAFKVWLEQWEEFDVEEEELIDAGDQVVLVLYIRGRGRESGVEVEMRLYEAWTLRGGKIVERRSYTDRDEARRAAGLT